MDQRKLTVTPTDGHRILDDKGRPMTGPTEVIWGMDRARQERDGSITVDRDPKPQKKTAKKKDED